MKILIATPFLPPHIGGPAFYGENLSREFRKLGQEVSVVSFSDFLKYPTGFRHIFYSFYLFLSSFGKDIIFALDQFTGGASVLVGLILRKPVVFRLEGDFLWEHFVERIRRDVTLKNFYKNPQPLSLKEKLIKNFSGWAIRRASKLVFSSQWRLNMIVEAYKVQKARTAIIKNAFSSYSDVGGYIRGAKIILWAGRMIYLKNLYRLISAFQKVRDDSWQLHLVGGGPEREGLKKFIKEKNIFGVGLYENPVDQQKLFGIIQDSAFIVLPSLSEVGPNIISEAVSLGTPFLITKETGFVEYINDTSVFIDPLDEEDIAAKMKVLMDDKKRKKAAERLRDFNFARSWEEVSREWLILFETL